MRSSRIRAAVDVIHVAGVGAVGGALILALPALFVILGSRNSYGAFFPLVILFGMFLPGVGLLVLAKDLGRRFDSATPAPGLIGQLARCAVCGGRLRADDDPSHRLSHAPGRPCRQRTNQARVAVLDLQVRETFRRLTLPETWRLQVAGVLQGLRAQEATSLEAKKVEERGRRLADPLVRNAITQDALEFENRRLALTLSAPTFRSSEAAMSAGTTFQDMLTRWPAMDEGQQSSALANVLDAVFCDLESEKVVAVKPKDDFAPFFAIAQGFGESEKVGFSLPT